MNLQNLKTEELDDAARRGLRHLRAYFDDEKPSEEIAGKATMCLKTAGEGTRRMTAETSRISLAFRIAKTVGKPPEDMTPLLAPLLPASAEAETGPQGALESTESTSSVEKKTRKRAK